MKAKCYVGLSNRFVMTEKFPNTEDYGGLHEMLEDWIDYDEHIADEPLEQGFYDLEFEIKQDIIFNPDKDMTDTYLVLKSYKRINNDNKT
jgi:hypothetical protein